MECKSVDCENCDKRMLSREYDLKILRTDSCFSGELFSAVLDTTVLCTAASLLELVSKLCVYFADNKLTPEDAEGE